MLNWILGRMRPEETFAPAARALDPRVKAYYEEQSRNYENELAAYADNRFLHSPRILSIETYVKCNATCGFCPYPTSDRIGQKLETEVIQKIIEEVSQSDVHPEFFVPARINEPLFDHRMFSIFEFAAKKLPHTSIGHFTNGTTLSERHIERLASMPNLGFINVSLNSHDPQEHKRLMGLDFDLVVKNLKNLHRVYAAKNPLFRRSDTGWRWDKTRP
jgi:MoaA/NifB/PqqE/SkfB family radical SAM enzyme